MKFEQKKANDRLIKIMNNLIAEKKCKNKKDFAEKLSSTPSTLTHISDYTQNIPYPMLYELHKVFGISIDYLLFGTGSQNIAEPKKNTLEDLIKRVSDLERKSP